MKAILRVTRPTAGEAFRFLFDALLVAAVALLIIQAGKAQTISLTNPASPLPATYAPGAAVPLSVFKTGNATATGIQFDLAVAAGGTITVAPGPVMPASKQLSCSSQLPAAALTCLIVGLNVDPIPDGVVAVVTVQLASAVASSPVVATISNVVEADGAGSALTESIGNPTVSLSIRNGCDVNGDGLVGSADFSAVVSVAVQKGTNATTDLNKDGKTNVLDAQIVGTAATAPAFTCLAH